MTDRFAQCQRELVQFQAGVVTRRQALAAGLTVKAIESRLSGGRWQRLYRGVYATFSGEPARPAQLWAAVLRAGPQAVLSHQTAAELYELASEPTSLIHVTVPSGSPVIRPPGLMIHYSGRLASSRHPALAPPRTRLEDTVLDLAHCARTADEAVSLALRAVGRRRTTPRRLAAAIGHRPRVRWRAELLTALDPVAQGAHSLLEYRYGTRVERPHGLPRGIRQRLVLRNGRHEYQDVSYEAYQTVVELDGRSAHPEEDRWHDHRRDNVNLAHGVATLRLGWLDVTEHPCASAALVGAALRHRGWRGSLRRCSPHCTLGA